VARSLARAIPLTTRCSQNWSQLAASGNVSPSLRQASTASSNTPADGEPIVAPGPRNDLTLVLSTRREDPQPPSASLLVLARLVVRSANLN
jgi:hypothetical protein